MKFFFALLLIVLAGIAGYRYEPQLRASLTGMEPGSSPAAVTPPPAPEATPPTSELPEEEPSPADLPPPPPQEEPSHTPDDESPLPEPVPTPPAPPENTPEVTEPSPDSTPSPAPGEEEGEKELSPVVLAMQESVKNGQVTEFTFENVTKWVEGPREAIEEEVYQTGFAECEVTTNFGSSAMQAKAYILHGEVARWVWPKTNQPIK
ncbi:MAG: hypothetical protein QM627_09175 [Luteolibacter sp.]